MASVLEVSESNWEAEVLNADLPVLVDFWAPWCGPCRALTPTIEAIAAEKAGKLKVVKCNIDSARTLAMKYGVQSIPLLSVFKGGRIVEQLLGAQPKGVILAKLEPHI